MSDKALFHRPGILVVKNENGEYQSIEDIVAEIDSEIEDKQSEISTTSDPETKKGLRSCVKSLQEKKKELTKDAMKLIDLNHKALIFLDTPNHTLLEAIMSLLSHDRHEVEYQFVDNFNGIKTKTNVYGKIRGQQKGSQVIGSLTSNYYDRGCDVLALYLGLCLWLIHDK